MSKRDPEQIMVACESVHLGPHMIVQGRTYRANHPAVRERPDVFLPWLDSTSEERAERNRELARRAGALG